MADMRNFMDLKRLREIEDMWVKVNSGPWFLTEAAEIVRDHPKGGGFIPYWDSGKRVKESDPYYPHNFNMETVAAVAHSREDVPFLLKHIKKLRERIEDGLYWKKRFLKLQKEVEDSK